MATDPTPQSNLPGFIIRQFSHQRACAGALELERVLLADFAGVSVSIQYRKASGMSQVIMVDVTPDGVAESYGERRLVDFAKLDREAS